MIDIDFIIIIDVSHLIIMLNIIKHNFKYNLTIFYNKY